jgi:hypothetical protein
MSLQKDMSERTRSLIQFLIEELAVSPNAIAISLQQSEQIDSFLAIVLWQYGFINLSELEKIFDWLAATTCIFSSAHPPVGVAL